MPNELLDVVNDDDIVIAQEMRSVVHRSGFLHRGVHVFLITPSGKLLVQQRGKDCETFPLALDCSISEHVKSGESYHQAALRGLAEEMGITGVHIHALVKFKMVYGPNDNEICILYEGRMDQAGIQFDPREVEGIAYFHLEELIELIHHGEMEFSSWFVQLINWYLNRPSEMNIIRTYAHSRIASSMSSRK
jgi:isopentenyldiphosphate isomerase